jgi:hypothetical protein
LAIPDRRFSWKRLQSPIGNHQSPTIQQSQIVKSTIEAAHWHHKRDSARLLHNMVA